MDKIEIPKNWLCLTIKPGEHIRIGQGIFVGTREGSRIKLVISADPSIPIERVGLDGMLIERTKKSERPSAPDSPPAAE